MHHAKSLNILALEPYLGGSHRAFLQGLRRHSRHQIRIVGLPPRKWKWRMRHAAIEFARRVSRMAEPADLILASDFLNVAEFAGLLSRRWQAVPRAVYFHENQLTYPIADESARDYQYAFTNLTTILASGAAWFNSAYHRDDFFAAMEALLRRMPDYRPLADLRAARRRSGVLHLGCDLAALLKPRSRRSGPATILWSQRWEADKDPETFLRVAAGLARDGLDFRLILMGEHYDRGAREFAPLLSPLGDRIMHAGYVESAAAYRRQLRQADMVVSTARHEFFGAGVVEAIAAGAYPLLPERLAYPEILPKRLHERHLYRTEGQLIAKLRAAIEHVAWVRQQDVASAVARFDWSRMVEAYDEALARAAKIR
jgi:glycosyltransferase involved in cell wall biosynthesis